MTFGLQLETMRALYECMSVTLGPSKGQRYNGTAVVCSAITQWPWLGPAVQLHAVLAHRNRHAGGECVCRLALAEEKAFERAKMLDDVAAAASDAAQRAAGERKAGVTRRLDLQTQIVAKAHMKAAEEDEKIREAEQVQKAEKAYISKVEHTLASTDPPVWHGRRKFEWN
jgi:hypothetical protein